MMMLRLLSNGLITLETRNSLMENREIISIRLFYLIQPLKKAVSSF